MHEAPIYEEGWRAASRREARMSKGKSMKKEQKKPKKKR
jgi:hypothetical protein